MKVFPDHAGGSTESLLRQLIHSFREIEDTVTKQISKLILSDLHSLLLDFHTQWGEVLADAKANGYKARVSNAAKSIVTVLSFYFKSLENYSNSVVFFKVLGQCCEVVVTRYILMLKERSAKSSKFSTEEVSLFCGDADYLKQYFDEAVVQAGKSLANESSKSIVAKTFHESGINNSWFQMSQEVLQTRCIRALRHFTDLKDLFQLDPTKEPFIAHCKSIVKRYENFPSSFGVPGVLGTYMTSVAATLRPDGTSGIATVISNIVDAFVKYSLASFGDSDSPSVQDLLEDPVFRVYGSRSTLGNEDDSGDTGVTTSQNRAISSFLSGSMVPMSPAKAPSSNNVGKESSKPALSGSMSFKNASSILSSAVSTPHNAMKMIREKAADFKLGGLKLIGGDKAKQKKLDQQTVETLKILGIIDDGADGDKASDDGSDDSSVASDTSEQDNIAADDVCVVKVSAIKLRGLKSGALFGSANPYVALTLGSKREKTSVIWGSKEWVWKSSISFKVSLSKLQSSKLSVKVFDKERVRRKRFLGSVTVKLAGLDVTEIQSWFALEGGDTGSNGDVYLSVQLDT